MKHILKIKLFTILVTALVLSVSSCEDFLNVDPSAYITKDDIQTPKDVKMILSGAYNSLTNNGIYREGMFLINELRSDNAWCDQNSYYANQYRLEFDKFYISGLNSGITNNWQHHWRAIGRCNYVIESALALDTTRTEHADLKQYIAEAQFLRALYNFNLVRIYGEIPIIKKLGTNIVEVSEHTKKHLSEVYNFIVEDLEQAANILPYRPQQTGRASRASALALKGKVYLTMAGYPYNNMSRNPGGLNAASCYDKAYEALDELTSDNPLTGASANYGLQLEPVYQELFDVNNEGNQEEIFAVQYMSGTGIGLGSPYPKMFGANGYQLNIPNNGDGRCVPTRNLINTYQFTYITDSRNTIDLADPNQVRDGRGLTIPATVNGQAYGQGYVVTGTVRGKGANANYFTGKYMSPGTTVANDADDNWYVLRLGDVVLMQAEILWEKGMYTEAIQKLNFIIERANNTVPDPCKLPLYDAADYDKESGRRLIQDERRRELAFEGHRWFDLVRTNRYAGESESVNRSVDIMNNYFEESYNQYLNGATDRYAFIDQLIYIQESDLLFKMPPLEINLNPALGEEPVQ